MTQSEPGNARNFTRVGVHLEIALDTGTHTPIEGYIRDLSASGLYIECDPGEATPADEGASGLLTLTLGDAGGPVIQAMARIVRVEKSGIALRIEEVAGEEGFVHLRNLVLYNAPDVDTAIAEFDAHVGLKPRD